MPRPRKPDSPFRCFNSSPKMIRLVVINYVRFPLSLRNVENLLFERGINLCHEMVRMWWDKFGRHCQTNQKVTRLSLDPSARVSAKWDQTAFKLALE